MTKITISDILKEMCADRAREFKAIKCKRHFFSLRHRRAMNKIFYPKPAGFAASMKKIPIRRRIVVLLIVVFIAMIGVTAGADIFNGLNTETHKDGIHIVTADWKDSLQEIKYVYHLPEVPEGFVFNDQGGGVGDIIYYENYMLGHQLLILMQTIKSNFHQALDDGIVPEEVDLNGKRAFYYESKAMGTIFWDNGDYILMVAGTLPKEDNPSGVFTKEDLINLAKSAKVLDTTSQNLS